MAYDRLNHEIQRTSPWVKVSATDDKQYQRIDRYAYNEAGLRKSTTDPQGFTRRNVYDSRLNIQIAYEPNPDFHTKTYYDRNRQTKQRIYSNPANATVSWKRDYFGLATDPENHRDHVQLDGVVIQYTYDFKRQILRQHAVVSGRATALELQEWSDFSNQGPLGTPQAQTYYQTIEQKLELQDLYFTYQVGRVVEVWDAVRQRKTVNGYNQEGYHVIRELRTVTGTIIRHWESQLNALNWPTLLRDTLMVMQRYYDGVGNRISEQVMLMGGENWEVIYQQSVYSTYDKDNSVLVDGGILKDGVIQISSAGGHLYTQSQGFRQKEQVYNLKGELVTNDLGYDGEGLLVKNGETELVYDGSRRRKLFNRPGNIIQDEYDENSWQVSSNQESAGNGMNEPLSDTVTLYSNYITEGIATVEKTNYYSDPNQTEDNLSWLLYGFDNYERRTLSGTRKDKNGDPHYVSTMEYERDGNQAYSGIKATSPNVQDPTKTDESEIVIDSTYDNLMLLKKTVGTGKTYPVSLSVTYEMPFYDPEGMYLGSYQHTSRGVGSETLNPYVSLQGIRQASSPLGPVSHGYRPQGWMNHGYDPSGYGEVTSINRHSSLTLADYTQPLTSVMQSGYTYQGVKGFQAHTSLSTNYPAPTPKVYQVQSGDTFKQISQKNYTTDQYEDQIKQASGLTDDSQLQPGMSIELPMLISSFNNADTYFPKQDVLNNLVGNYYPYLIGPLPPPPKHQHNWWKVIVASLIDAAIIAIMPHLMPLALGISASATGWAGFFLNTAIGAASGLSTQMANDALGVSHGFSWRTFGASVVGQQLAFLNPTNATMKSGLLDPFRKLDGMLSKFKMLANNHILQAMEQAGRVALEEQAVQLASDGGRLDLGAVFTQMVTAGMQANVSMQNLKIYQQAEFSGVSTFIGGELTQVVHGDRLNIAQVAAQSIGNSFGTYEGGKMDEASRAYQQAKMAQQGKGNPTQTSQSQGKPHTKSQMTTSDVHQEKPVSKADTWNGKVGPSKKNWDYQSMQAFTDQQSLVAQVRKAVGYESDQALAENMVSIETHGVISNSKLADEVLAIGQWANQSSIIRALNANQAGFIDGVKNIHPLDMIVNTAEFMKDGMLAYGFYNHDAQMRMRQREANVINAVKNEWSILKNGNATERAYEIGKFMPGMFAAGLSDGAGFFGKVPKGMPSLESNIYKLNQGGLSSEMVSSIPEVKFNLWYNYLSKRGVNFEIGTQKAYQVLSENNALGLFEQKLIDIETNTFNRTIYLPSNPNASTFYEEGLHALDSLKGRSNTMTYEGKKIDAYEYRAKQILISAAPKRFKYEEFNLLENQLELVKNNQYGMK